jgi:hypothetical protein
MGSAPRFAGAHDDLQRRIHATHDDVIGEENSAYLLRVSPPKSPKDTLASAVA